MDDTLTGATLVEAAARAFEGPQNVPPATSQFTLEELREYRWDMLTNQSQNDCKRRTRAALRAAVAAAGVEELALERAANDILDLWTKRHGPIAGLLRALAEVIRTEP